MMFYLHFCMPQVKNEVNSVHLVFQFCMKWLFFFGWGRCPVDFNRLKGLPRNFYHTTNFHTGAGMSLIKKKHQHIRDEYLRFTLLNVDDFLDTNYIFRSKKNIMDYGGNFLP